MATIITACSTFCWKWFFHNFNTAVIITAFSTFCRKGFFWIRTLRQQLDQVFISAKIIRSAFSKSWWEERHTYTNNLFHVFRLILPLISHCMTLFCADFFADESHWQKNREALFILPFILSSIRSVTRTTDSNDAERQPERRSMNNIVQHPRYRKAILRTGEFFRYLIHFKYQT